VSAHIVRHMEAPIDLVVDRMERGAVNVVLTASERQAHAIRRFACVERSRPDLVAGVRFLRPADFACELLLRSGRVRRPGWEPMRRLRILQLFDGELLRLRYFNTAQLRNGRGYANAFARTIGDLEAGGLEATLTERIAATLASQEALASDRLRDVAITWQAADAERGASATAAQLLAEAALVVAAEPRLGNLFGPVLAVLCRAPATVLGRFLSALPDCEVLFQDARPLRAGTQRWRPRLGLPTTAGSADAGRSAWPAPTSELDLVRRFLFETPDVLTHPSRPRSAGADASVDLEEYASVEDELEATAGWVAEQITAGTPLEEIAVLVPEIDVYAPFLIDRLQRLGGDGASVGVHVAGGLPLSATPAGQRVNVLLHALARGLEAEATIRLLPCLRRADQGREDPHARLSPSRAAEIVYGAGIVGGSRSDPAGVCEWSPRLRRRCTRLRQAVADEAGIGQDSEPPPRAAALDRQEAQRWLRDMEPILPAIDALQQLAECLLGGATLAALWKELRVFADRWLRIPPEPPQLLAALAVHMEPILGSPLAHALTGFEALHVITETLASARWTQARFGEPCVFAGTPAHAAGLTFRAVRILGLAEGALPHTPHDDPIVPDVLRQRIEEAAALIGHSDVVLAQLGDRVLDEIHDVFRAVAGSRRCLALSLTRQWVDRSDREVSGIVLEAATALARPALGTANGDGDVPTAARLRAGYLDVGSARRAAVARDSPLSPRAVVTMLPAPARDGSDRLVPSGWMSSPAMALDRIDALAGGEGAGGAAHGGLLTDVWEAIVPPGLTPQRPISATALATLLSCPHRFLLERILYFKEPPRRPATDVIPPLAYGSLFHAAAERFFREAGHGVCHREGSLTQWLDRARALAADELAHRQETYPLRGDDGIAQARERLLRQVEQLVRYEWDLPVREFVATELRFGDPDPVCLPLSGGPLYLRGAIDRVDRVGPGALAVRDLKTGRVRDTSEEEMNAVRDVQIGLYVLVLEALGAPDGESATHVTHAAYVHPSAAQDPERGFAEVALAQLRERTREWLGVAERLLRLGLFPRTPNAEDCTYCPFLPACGAGAQEHSRAALEQLPDDHPLQAFVSLKRRRLREDA
jgi:RecB family exonuclease